MATLVFGVGSAWATAYKSFLNGVQQASTTISSSNVSNGTVGVISWTGTNCSYSLSRVNISAGGSITFTASTGYVITKIVIISGSSAAYYGTWTSSPSVTPTSSDGTTTLDGFNSKSVTVTTSTAFRCTSASSISIHYAAAPSFEITANSNNNEWGTVSLEETTITASPKSGYRVVAGDGGYTVTAGEATVVNNGDNTFTVTPSTDCTVRINFEAIPTHKANFSVNGAVSSNDVQEGADIDFPADPADLGGKKFVGWAAATISGTTDEEPAFVSSAVMGTTDVTYYAVFATLTPGDAETFVDELTLAETGVSGTNYTEWSDVTVTSVAVYAGQSAGGNEAIQLRSNNNNSGIVTTTSGGKVKKVVLTWNSNTASGRTVNVYGSNTAYTDATDLYDAEKKGTELGTIVNGTSTELNITGDYAYVGLRSNSGALYLDEVAITWETGTPDAYSAYCTSVTVPLTISDAGYATFCSTSALDFSDVDDVTAYTASLSGSTVTFNKVTGSVPAGTGLLLKGAADTYNIPVVASSTTDVSGNKLVGVTAATEIDGTSGNFFVLKKVGENVGFYKVNNAAYTVRANTAYLNAEGAGAKDFIGFDDDETTAIDNLTISQFVKNAPVYNLAGQKVSNSYKGIVIVNGKKYINK